MTFADVVMEAFSSAELVANFERLYGVRISNWQPPQNQIEAMIDESTGNQPVVNEDAARAFIRFVRVYVWERLPPECFMLVECDEAGK